MSDEQIGICRRVSCWGNKADYLAGARVSSCQHKSGFFSSSVHTRLAGPLRLGKFRAFNPLQIVSLERRPMTINSH